MSRPTQLVLNTVKMPYVSGDRYSCSEQELSKTMTMAAGNLVKEVLDPGKVWSVEYSADYMDDETYRAARSVLLSGKSFSIAALPDNGDEMIAITVLVTSFTRPTFAFAENGKAVWHGLAFTLREVEPHA